ncbi:MAG TPA: hypothetical protein VEX39_05180 [Thermoleophilaceae bacterium]|nr:hypothetical protein [Thermoleophilaceae bacterium]
MARDTGMPQTDASFDFARERRRRAIGKLSSRLRLAPADVNVILPFDEVVEALGRRGEKRLGLESIPLDSIVGTVDRGREFDRDFRPTTNRVRTRWERIATAQRQGKEMPPIDVYRIGELHFVKDGHHRVSVARAMGFGSIDAYVTEILTVVRPDPDSPRIDLPLKSHERLFRERVPLPPEAHARIELSDEWRYAGLAEGVEAWGFRAMQARQEPMTRDEVAQAWFDDEYVPVVEMLREADLLGQGTETEAYIRVVTLRFLTLGTHEWTEEVLERLRGEIRRPSRDDDTMVRRLRKELR